VAHHAVDPEFDRAQQANYKATVTSVAFKNPHVLFYAEVTGADGKSVEWEFETGAPAVLIRANLTKDSIREGDTLTVRAMPAKDGSNRARTVRITFPDGKIFEDESSLPPRSMVIPTRAPAGAHGNTK
jgi:hypothetical protein